MEPRIQYAKTEDGVSIAYWTLGEGSPLVVMPAGPLSHIQLEWQWPQWRYFYERLSEGRKLIRYDGRGTGLSEREVTEYSLDMRVLDLEAVTQRLGLERFALWGSLDSGPVAIAYAARWPERVSHLTLWCTWPKPSDPAWTQAMDELIKKDWQMGSETLAHGVLGWSGEEARRLAALIRECVTPEGLLACLSAGNDFDSTDLLTQVRSPTLVLHRRQLSFPDVNVARSLAAGISDARLALLEGNEIFAFLGDVEPVLQAINDFLDEGSVPTEAALSLPEGTAIILFADIAGSTALTEQLGDTAFRARARNLDTALRAAINEVGGTPVEGKVMGDGVMATFPSARQAIGGAVRCSTLGDAAGLPLHLGIHAGDVIREENTVYGGAVNIASRIADAAPPGEILVSDTVRGLARTSVEAGFEDRGEHELQGVAEPQRLFAVRWREQG